MKAAGWMIFIGDMLHNFIDGLTLGAAFMVSIGEGLRMTLPIACEEFPHELGDLAVLLSSGLSIGQAIIVNFLSACSCYLGFFVGAKLGELEEFHPWIYALAGGMFVYVGLADMVPELVSMGDEIEKDHIDSKKSITTILKLKILLCQNSGFILGVILMFLLGKYDQAIYCDSTGSSISTPDDDDHDESYLFTLENRHAYFLFVYFNFFFDCFLGIVSCISRLFKSGIALILYMPRLDYSIFGRSLEKIDNGYTAYTSYLYVEAMHTHPILITFTQIIYMNILDKRRRQKHFLLIDDKQILEQYRRKCLRFRWFLLITLMNNLSLIPTRRHHQKLTINRHNQKINQRTLSDSLVSNGTVTVNMCQ
ncbi:unnamed protein product [Rotaria sp. Silwood2]|nr:unnamed protein product [Rotaria sp. Silwood2]